MASHELQDPCTSYPRGDSLGLGVNTTQSALDFPKLTSSSAITLRSRLESSLKFRARVLREGQQKFWEGKKLPRSVSVVYTCCNGEIEVICLEISLGIAHLQIRRLSSALD